MQFSPALNEGTGTPAYSGVLKAAKAPRLSRHGHSCRACLSAPVAPSSPTDVAIVKQLHQQCMLQSGDACSIPVLVPKRDSLPFAMSLEVIYGEPGSSPSVADELRATLASLPLSRQHVMGTDIYELLYVLEGSGTVRVSGQNGTVAVASGDSVMAAAGRISVSCNQQQHTAQEREATRQSEQSLFDVTEGTRIAYLKLLIPYDFMMAAGNQECAEACCDAASAATQHWRLDEAVAVPSHYLEHLLSATKRQTHEITDNLCDATPSSQSVDTTTHVDDAHAPQDANPAAASTAESDLNGTSGVPAWPDQQRITSIKSRRRRQALTAAAAAGTPAQRDSAVFAAHQGSSAPSFKQPSIRQTVVVPHLAGQAADVSTTGAIPAGAGPTISNGPAGGHVTGTWMHGGAATEHFESAQALHMAGRSSTSPPSPDRSTSGTAASAALDCTPTPSPTIARHNISSGTSLPQPEASSLSTAVRTSSVSSSNSSSNAGPPQPASNNTRRKGAFEAALPALEFAARLSAAPLKFLSAAAAAAFQSGARSRSWLTHTQFVKKSLSDAPSFRLPNQDNLLALVFDPTSHVDAPPFTFGVEIFPPSHLTTPHVHATAYELFFIISGEGTAFCNGTRFRVGPGDTVVFPPGCEHGIDNDEGCRMYCLELMLPNEEFAELVRAGTKLSGLDKSDMCVLAPIGCR